MKTKPTKIFYLFLLIFIIKFIILLTFNDNDWEPDSFQHFNELRTVYSNIPSSLEVGLGVWAKPLYTFPYGLVTLVPFFNKLFAVQVLNTLVMLIVSFFVYKIVLEITKKNTYAILSIFLTQFSFTLLSSSLSSLTEPIFSLMLILGVYHSFKRNYYWASLFFGLSVLARIEGLFFVGVYFLYLIANFKIKTVNLKLLISHFITLSLPTLIWNFLGFLISGKLLYIFQAGYPTSGAQYGTGSLLYYPARFLIVETVISLLVLLSITIFLLNWKQIKRKTFFIFLYFLSLGFLLTQIITWRFGLFGSAGLMRYFVSILPIMVILGCAGIYWQKNFKLKYDHILVVLVHFVVLFVNIFGISFIDSKWINSNEIYKKAGEWVKVNTNDSDYVGTDRVEIVYYSGKNLSEVDNNYVTELNKNAKGYYLWTKSWGESVFNINYEKISSKARLIEIIEDEIYVFRID